VLQAARVGEDHRAVARGRLNSCLGVQLALLALRPLTANVTRTP